MLIFLGGRYVNSARKLVDVNKIFEFNYETESWTEIGTMNENRGNPGVSVVSYDDYAKWCK